ncbi:MAG: MFS transporter [Candidatus Bathyarchaeia archaeon]
MKIGYSRLLLPVLALSVFCTFLITVAFQLLLIDIAQSFQVNVGTAGLVASVGAVSGIICGILLSVASVRINHKLFVLIGLAFTASAAVDFFLAPSFELLLLGNIGVGGGMALVGAMAYSLIGEFYPLQKRGRAIGCIVASGTLSYVVGAPLIGLIAQSASWRQTMIWMVLPLTLISLLLAFLVIPKKSPQHLPGEKEPFWAGCKQAFSTPSAVACLLVSMLLVAESSMAFYSISFFRSQFQIGVDVGSVVSIVTSILSAVGGIISGLLINRLGRKSLGIVTCLVATLLTVVFTFMPNFSLSFGLYAVKFWFGGMASTALGSMIIEQVPKFRATMTSLNTAFVNGGILLASVTAGVTLNFYSYQVLAAVLSGLSFVGIVLWFAFVKDVSRN